MSIGGIVGGLAGSMLTGMLDGALADDNAKFAPIPSFIFEVGFYAKPSSPKLSAPEPASKGASILAGAMGALPSTSLFSKSLEETGMTNPGKHSWEKAFIEVAGLEYGIEIDNKQEGGNNFPFNFVTKMKTQNVTLKRLIRPAIIKETYNEKKEPTNWNAWIKHTMEAMSLWTHPIILNTVQINVMHPNLQSNGDPHILMSIELIDSFPIKVSYGTLSSSSEDLITQEIEIAFREAKYNI
jgi:hypothetical protein